MLPARVTGRATSPRERADIAPWHRTAGCRRQVENRPVDCFWLVDVDDARGKLLQIRVVTDVGKLTRAEESFEDSRHVAVEQGTSFPVNDQRDRIRDVLPNS